MRRRDLLLGLAGALTAPRLGFAQQRAGLPRVALASPTVPRELMAEGSSDRRWSSFLVELRRLGFVEGQNVILERYSTLGVADPEELGRAIARSRPSVIFVGGHTAMARAAAITAPDIPVVFQVADALASGLVSSLAHPGGNLTGVTTTPVDIEGKKMGMLHEVVPQAMRLAFLDTITAYEPLGHRTVVEAAAAALGLTLFPVIVDRPFDEVVFQTAFDDIKRKGAQIVELADSTNIAASWSIIVRLADAARLPTCSGDPAFLDFGGLMSYGANRGAVYARAASYVAQILRGAKAGDLPVQEPSQFELGINRMAATELGLELPPSLLLQAVEVRG